MSKEKHVLLICVNTLPLLISYQVSNPYQVSSDEASDGPDCLVVSNFICNKDFAWHLKACGDLALTHLVFADDLLILLEGT